MIKDTKKNDLKGLAIDTADQFGGIALLEHNKITDLRHLEKEISRSADLVFRIKDLLLKNNLKVKDIDFVSYCRGPGSFTGIRIGAATSYGISRSNGGSCIGVTKFEALALVSEKSKPLDILVKGGTENIFIYRFSKSCEITKGDKVGFKTKKISELTTIDFSETSEIILQKSLYKEYLSKILEGNKKIKFTLASDNISDLIGLKALEKLKGKPDDAKGILPIYTDFYTL